MGGQKIFRWHEIDSTFSDPRTLSIQTPHHGLLVARLSLLWLRPQRAVVPLLLAADAAREHRRRRQRVADRQGHPAVRVRFVGN